MGRDMLEKGVGRNNWNHRLDGQGEDPVGKSAKISVMSWKHRFPSATSTL